MICYELIIAPPIQILWRKWQVTDSKRVSLLPGNGCSPCVEPHFVWQGLRNSKQDETDVSQSNQRSHQDHQVVSIPGRQVSTDGWTRYQAGCKGGRHLESLEDRKDEFQSDHVHFFFFFFLGFRFCVSNSTPPSSHLSVWQFEVILRRLEHHVMSYNILVTIRSPYQTIGGTPLSFLCHISHVGKDDWEGDRKSARHGDHGEVPPGWWEGKNNIWNRQYGWIWGELRLLRLLLRYFEGRLKLGLYVKVLPVSLCSTILIEWLYPPGAEPHQRDWSTGEEYSDQKEGPPAPNVR